MWSPQICLFLVVTPVLVCAAPTASTAHSVAAGSIRQHLVNVGPEDLTVKRSAAVDSLDSTVKRSARIDSFLAIPSTGFSCSAQAVPGIYADQETGCQVFHYCQGDGRMDSFFCPNLTLFNQQYFVCDWEYNVDCNSAPQYYSLNEALYKSPEKIYQAINPAIKIVQTELLQGAASSEVSRTLNSLVSQLDSRSSAIVVDSPPAPQPTLRTQAQTDREGKSVPLQPKTNSLLDGREGKSVETSAGPNTSQPYAGTTASIVIPVATVTVSSVVKADSTAGVVTTGYATADVVDDAVADPEPDCLYTGDCSPPVGASGSYATADDLVDDAYNTINTGGDAYAAANAGDAYATTNDDAAYDDAVADPEPACYYSGDCTPSDTYAVVDTIAGYDAADDAIADPEPAAYYSPAPASSVYADDGPSYADALSSVYDPYDSADPEPSAIPYSTSGSYGQYDSADPEPDSYYGYYDSADPEPASYYGANTIDLSSSSVPLSQYSSQDVPNKQVGDYDDAVADPEPDPASYGADINLYDSGYQQPSYGGFSASNAINDYYKGYPSQGLVVDSPDPEPSSDPEFTPYGE